MRAADAEHCSDDDIVAITNSIIHPTLLLIYIALTCLPFYLVQSVELKASKVLHVGITDASTYPMAKKKLGLEFLREKMHLRPRTNTISVVARIRNALAYATHRLVQYECSVVQMQSV